MKFFVTSLLLASSFTALAQSNYKESSNNFAMYTKSGELNKLENARKFIDEAYKTKRDSSNSRINILRAMIYSSLAYADSNRTIKTSKDPIDISYDALAKLKRRDLENYEPELKYSRQNLAAAHIFKANKALEKKDFQSAYDNYLKVRALKVDNKDVTYNLALLAAQTGKNEHAVDFYKQLLSTGNASPENYLELAQLYVLLNERQTALNTLQDGRAKFMDNQAILLQLIQLFSENGSYSAIVPVIDEALKADPDNIELIYLAGFSNESEGNVDAAKKYYSSVLKLDENNFESNLALGLIHLGAFLKDTESAESQYNAQDLLLKANEIRPYDVNALKALALYYQHANDPEQLDRVKLLLNQLSNN